MCFRLRVSTTASSNTEIAILIETVLERLETDAAPLLAEADVTGVKHGGSGAANGVDGDGPLADRHFLWWVLCGARLANHLQKPVT